MTDLIAIRRALLSVSDKTHLINLAHALNDFQIEIIASGGTARTLLEAGFKVTPVEKISGKGEAFQGRMKTLSFEISSALLYKRHDPKDMAEAQRLQISPIDLVVVNLYPFHEAVARAADSEEVIENIDIGGPTLLRAGAKNYSSVVVLSRPEQYADLINELQEFKGATTLEKRKSWSTEAFTLTAFYDLEIASHLTATSEKTLRYGENPHQRAVVLKNRYSEGLAQTNLLQGKAMSYNNYLDSDFALQTLKDFCAWKKDLKTAVIVKHNTPCGIAMHEDPLIALSRSWTGDEKSSFGSVIALNFTVTETIAAFFEEKYVEVIMAPAFEADALKKLKKNCRLMKIKLNPVREKNVRSIEGGILIQDKDQYTPFEMKSVTKNRIPAILEQLAEFTFLCVKNLKSNSIALARPIDSEKSFELLTMGSGQTNRIDCIEKLVASRLKDKNIKNFENIVLASDAFFPFADSILAAKALGIHFIVQPGGSIKDNEVIAEANRQGIAMSFTGRRHFLH